MNKLAILGVYLFVASLAYGGSFVMNGGSVVADGGGIAIDPAPSALASVTTNSILVDFSDEDYLTGTDAVGRVWNTYDNGVSAYEGNPNSLLYATNIDSGIDMIVIGDSAAAVGFNPNANPNGMVTVVGDALSYGFVSTATRDSHFGHTSTFDEDGPILQVDITFTNCDPDGVYEFILFACRDGVTDNRETTYTIGGTSVSLDVHNNTGGDVAIISDVTPSASNTITLVVAPGANNDNALGFYYLGAMSIIEVITESEPEPPASVGLDVLFIGNSFTAGYGGNETVADIFDALANAAGEIDPNVDIQAPGGTDYQYHSTNATTQTAIASTNWDYVVMQNYSTEPTHIGSVADHMLYGTNLYLTIMDSSTNTRVMVYETWSRAEANALITGTTNTATTFASTYNMTRELVTNYNALADSLTAGYATNHAVTVNPVGSAFYNAGGCYPASDPDYIDLWHTDNYHADDRGYYLSACVHYACIYSSSPAGLYTNADVQALSLTLSEADAAFLEGIAWDTVTAE